MHWPFNSLTSKENIDILSVLSYFKDECYVQIKKIINSNFAVKLVQYFLSALTLFIYVFI